MSPAVGSSRPLDSLTAWGVLVVLAAIIATGAALAPLPTAAAVICLSLAVVTMSRYGALEGAWVLLLFTLPLREPLGYDILGTRTLYASDVLLFLVAVVVALRHGVKAVWMESGSLRLGVAILLWSALGLYFRNDASAIVAIHRILGQVGIFFVARHVIRSGAAAERAIVWFLAGLSLAILYGFYQASVPLVGASYPTWSKVPIAYDSAGVPHIRVFSTFDHTLHYSQALSMGFGMAAALLFGRRSTPLRVFGLTVAVAAGICNQLTYSVSGIVGTAVAAVAVVLGQRRRRLALVLPVLAVITLLVAPNALYQRVEHLATGRSLSTVVRVLTYREGLRSFLDHPILGVGWGGIPELRENFVSQKSLPPAPENYFLHRAVAIGAPGLLLFVALLVAFARNWRRSRGVGGAWPRLAVGVGVVTYFAQAMFFPGENYTNNYFLWVLLAIAETMAREARGDQPA